MTNEKWKIDKDIQFFLCRNHPVYIVINFLKEDFSFLIIYTEIFKNVLKVGRFGIYLDDHFFVLSILCITDDALMLLIV